LTIRLSRTKYLAALSALRLLIFSACVSGRSPEATQEPALETGAPVVLETQPPEPTASPMPEPEMVIDEAGDITLRSDIVASFFAASYPFDHKPTVLIYHTHATESYLKTEEQSYVETERGRTLDGRYSVIAVGDALATALENLGFTVIHDTTNVEGDDLSSAYSRS